MSFKRSAPPQSSTVSCNSAHNCFDFVTPYSIAIAVTPRICAICGIPVCLRVYYHKLVWHRPAPARKVAKTARARLKAGSCDSTTQHTDPAMINSRINASTNAFVSTSWVPDYCAECKLDGFKPSSSKRVRRCGGQSLLLAVGFTSRKLPSDL
jgi:hypothetical protein